MKQLTFLTFVIGICEVGRLIFQFIPNVQPVTDIIILTTLIFGLSNGLLVGVLSIVVSNIILGMGVWTLAQIGAYILIVLLTYFLAKPWFFKAPIIVRACFCAAMGFFYGFVISIIQAPILGINNFLPYYIAGLPFDLMHALGNAGFCLILSPTLVPLLKKIHAQLF
ncbi:ECF transporter S component [Periweissella cryptocerci]|uniref:ECF transporter S component n=2 Tax=Periweissella cryptocerci TaxID=2506420 RepID=A0A4P6YX44_9LACO|nr:ECF transporter S component [Periweissella cryptocerci]